jgi:hypothetical protein
MGAEEAMGVPVPAFSEQMKVEIGQLRRVCVGIVDDMLMVFAIRPDQAIVRGKGGPIAVPFEQVAVPDPCEPTHTLEDGDLQRARQEYPHDGVLPFLVTP